MVTFRKQPLVTGEIYHVFNRGLDKRVTFGNVNEYVRAVQSMKYYQHFSPPVKLSEFLRASDNLKNKMKEASWGNKLVSIIAYCFMPNHFHFMLKQEIDGGISKFVGQFLNSYTRYYNTKNKRVGGLFLDRFKNVLVISEAQLLHLTRYIHLNPYSSGVIRKLDDLASYKWSSLPEYLFPMKDEICCRNIIEGYFKSKQKYKEFVFSRAEYQKELKELED